MHANYGMSLVFQFQYKPVLPQISTFYCEAFNQILIIKYFYLSLTHFFLWKILKSRSVFVYTYLLFYKNFIVSNTPCLQPILVLLYPYHYDNRIFLLQIHF